MARTENDIAIVGFAQGDMERRSQKTETEMMLPVVAEAIAGRRADVFLVSKAYPHNAGRRGLPQACERSLKRLGLERIDLIGMFRCDRAPRTAGPYPATSLASSHSSRRNSRTNITACGALARNAPSPQPSKALRPRWTRRQSQNAVAPCASS
jgi:hypothetical protein